MSRSLIIFSFATIVLTVLSIPFMVLYPGEFVLGGHYYIAPGESLEENISFYFAQVVVDEGASVNGHVLLVSSTLDLRGNVTEDIHAFESDLTLRGTAHVEGRIDQNALIHWTLLLPALAQIP